MPNEKAKKEKLINWQHKNDEEKFRILFRFYFIAGTSRRSRVLDKSISRRKWHNGKIEDTYDEFLYSRTLVFSRRQKVNALLLIIVEEFKREHNFKC